MSYLLYYEVGLGLAGILISGFFLYLLQMAVDWETRRIAYKFTAALTFFSVSVLTQILDQTWKTFSIAGVNMPSLNVMFEAIVMAFMISGLWDIWNIES